MNLAAILHPFSRVGKVIAVALALAACVCVTSLTKAGADTQTVSASATSGATEFQGESMTKPTGTTVFNDPMYAGGAALRISNNTATPEAQGVVFTETSDVVVYVRALQGYGSPSLRLFVDGVDKGAKAITNSGAPEPYTWDVNVPPGAHTLRLKASNTGTERNPLIDILRFPAEPLPPPPPPSNLLSWAPPTLTNPITVNVPANDTRYGNGVTKVVLASGQDARINLPSTTKVGGLWIEGGRNVVVIGGHIQPNPNHVTTSGALGMRGIYVNNNTGVVHIEGVLIDSPDDREYDAMEIDSGGTTLQLENNRWLGVAGTYSTNHGDVLQPFGTGVREVRIDRLTASSRYQGLQLYDQYNSLVTAQRVDLTASPQTSGTSGGHMVWVGDDSCGQLSPYSFSEVYVSPRPDRTLGDSIWPTSGADASTCPAQLQNGFASWPLFPAITGGVALGPPPGGEFVPVGAAGIGYVSPGYLQ